MEGSVGHREGPPWNDLNGRWSHADKRRGGNRGCCGGAGIGRGVVNHSGLDTLPRSLARTMIVVANRRSAKDHVHVSARFPSSD